MTAQLRLFRLWRTSGVLCLVGAGEFLYVAYVRRQWWPLIVVAALVVVAGLAFRRAGAARRAMSP